MLRLAAVLPFSLSLLLAQQPSQQPSPPPSPTPPPAAPPQRWTTTLLAFTGFAHPDPEAMERSDDGMVSVCHGRLVFYVRFAFAGELDLALTRTEGAPATTIVATLAPHGNDANATTPPRDAAPHDAAPAQDATTTTDVPAQGETDTMPLGKFTIRSPGFHRLTLATKDGSPLRCLHSITLTGPAAQNAHAITRERRNAASVHLGYRIAPNAATTNTNTNATATTKPEANTTDAEWFYCEVTPRTDPVHTFYMATGWSRGYFGVQVNSATERRFIFSVWDAGNEATDRSKVAADDRVQLIAKGDGVVAEDFGNEGTGGHSHVVRDWKLGGTFAFLVHAAIDGTHTTYTGWSRMAPAEPWQLIASFRAPKDGKGLQGLHSFVENFSGSNGDLARDCEFGNVWARVGGAWRPLREAAFTQDATGRQRLDRWAGVREDRFYLHTGGFTMPPEGAAVTRNQPVRVPDSARTHPADATLPTPPAAAATK